MKNWKVWGVILLVLVLVIGGFAAWWEMTRGNRTQLDTKFHFDRAIIRLPNGESLEGKVSSWLDFSDSDVVQIKMDGKTYLTSYNNVCLIDD